MTEIEFPLIENKTDDIIERENVNCLAIKGNYKMAVKPMIEFYQCANDTDDIIKIDCHLFVNETYKMAVNDTNDFIETAT